jgi:hypothetical protein
LTLRKATQQKTRRAAAKHTAKHKKLQHRPKISVPPNYRQQRKVVAGNFAGGTINPHCCLPQIVRVVMQFFGDWRHFHFGAENLRGKEGLGLVLGLGLSVVKLVSSLFTGYNILRSSGNSQLIYFSVLSFFVFIPPKPLWVE